MKCILTILAVLIIASCAPSSDSGSRLESKIPTFDRTGEIMSVQIITYDNYADLNRAYYKFNKEKANGPKVPEGVRVGWSAWSVSSPYQCVMHVKKSQYVDDAETVTWGHELQHCVYGEYHK